MIINSINYDTTGNYICYKLLVKVKSLLNMALWLHMEHTHTHTQHPTWSQME